MAERAGYYTYDKAEDVPVHGASTSDEQLRPDTVPGYGRFGSDDVTEMTAERPLSDSFPSAAEPLESEEA